MRSAWRTSTFKAALALLVALAAGAAAAHPARGIAVAPDDTVTFSDRDVAAFEAPFGIRGLGVGRANKRLLETVAAVEPDLVIAGHCDMISNETLRAIKALRPSCVVIHCNNDPLFVPSNVERIKSRASVVDAVFVSTGRSELRMFEGLGARVYHMPNPVDASVETLDNSRRSDLPVDLVFCSNSDDFTERLAMVGRLMERLKD